jgi:putative heme iron utilization protein
MSDRPLSTAIYEPFLDSFRSLILATVNAGGLPEASYAPYVRDEDKNFYLLASELANHTANLMTSTQASVLFIEDEDKSQQIFGRRRLSFSCQVKEVNRSDRQWTTIIDRMRLAHGERVAAIATLEDFHLFKLIPQQGRFVQGFGGIYEIGGQGMGAVTLFQPQRLN